jgi:phenylacetate-coenzyme A ligase PaaK-like adenylate-forming protein
MAFPVTRFLSALFARRFLGLLAKPPGAAGGKKRERGAIRAFRRAARRQRVYREILRRLSLKPESVRTPADFRKLVPVVRKREIFGGAGLSGFLDPSPSRPLRTLYLSSGFTRAFAFGALSGRDLRRAGFFLEEILFRLYGIGGRRLLLVNCLPLGTEIPVTRFPQAKTGLRSDIVVEVLGRAAADSSSVVLIGEPLFLKRVAEEASAAGVDWGRLRLWIFTGSEYVSEYWRAYLQSLLGLEPDRPERGGIYFTYGLTELGVAVGFETAPLAALRRELTAERERTGTGAGRSCPPFLHYLPRQYFLETAAGPDGGTELVVTALEKGRLIPLVRYGTGDEAELYSPAEITRLLARFGLEKMKPVIRGLPAVALHGRRLSVGLPDGRMLSANEVKDVLFRDRTLARAVSGNFRIERGAGGAATRLLVQLVPDRAVEPDLAGRLEESLAREGADGLPVELFAFRDFPFGFEHEYERKNRYLE